MAKALDQGSSCLVFSQGELLVLSSEEELLFITGLYTATASPYHCWALQVGLGSVVLLETVAGGWHFPMCPHQQERERLACGLLS